MRVVIPRSVVACIGPMLADALTKTVLPKRYVSLSLSRVSTFRSKVSGVSSWRACLLFSIARSGGRRKARQQGTKQTARKYDAAFTATLCFSAAERPTRPSGKPMVNATYYRQGT